ncbi:MAG: SIMPL domain-containing protein [Acidobacteriaceae bacterium]|nr:SIMPL domain-containing protein [Acidobacteriaceae bacterium]
MLRLFVCLFVLLASQLAAQDSPRPHFVRASGEAIISAKPDRAEVTIAVSTRASTAQAASAQNASESTRVLGSIKQALRSGGQVKTGGYSLAPQYDYSNGHAPRLTGYEASNSVIVTVDELSLLGKVIDAATVSGANNVNGISFTLRDSSAVREQALAEAATRARANAEALAKALQVQVIGLLDAEPTEAPVVRPLAKSFGAMPMALQAATPIEAGDLDIRATVTVTLQVR